MSVSFSLPSTIRLSPAKNQAGTPLNNTDSHVSNTATLNLGPSLGSHTIGLASLGTIATDHTKALSASGDSLGSALTGGYHLAYLVAAACVAVGILAAFLVLRRPGAGLPQEVDAESELASIEPVVAPAAQAA